ncbi:acyltransferase [uncultured Thiobacillus sp.]|uniref:acyltransferase n=1 Tax=uncultured Thiobacillus sp. TaxID=189996 RepID=UPI00262B0036|nr:acyltransferase [uncultured Thiobacillus sp.]
MLFEKIKKNGLIRLIKIYSERVISRLRGLLFGMINTNPRFPKGLRVGRGVRSTVRFLNVGDNVTIGHLCSFGGLGSVKLADNVVLNRNVHIDASEYIEIGKNTLVGPDCYFVDSNHQMPQEGWLVSANVTSSAILVEKSVWFGRNVTVLAGLTIGEYSVIGASSVVTKPIPPRSVAKGVPAKARTEKK